MVWRGHGLEISWLVLQRCTSWYSMIVGYIDIVPTWVEDIVYDLEAESKHLEIKVHNHHFIYVILKIFDSDSWKERWYILETKMHDFICERSKFTNKCGLMSVFFRNRDLIINWEIVCERTTSITSDFNDNLIGKGCREWVGQRNFIQS